VLFNYETVLGQIDLENDSEQVRNYKAGVGAIRYALRNAGWSEIQISNSLRTHFESVADVLAVYLDGLCAAEPDTDVAAGLYAAYRAIRPGSEPWDRQEAPHTP
jgi:hypothetical protein